MALAPSLLAVAGCVGLDGGGYYDGDRGYRPYPYYGQNAHIGYHYGRDGWWRYRGDYDDHYHPYPWPPGQCDDERHQHEPRRPPKNELNRRPQHHGRAGPGRRDGFEAVAWPTDRAAYGRHCRLFSSGRS